MEHSQPIIENKPSMKQRVLAVIGLPLWVLISFITAALIVSALDAFLRDSGILTDSMVSSSLRNTVIAALVYILSLVIVIGLPLKLRNVRTTKEELGLTKLPTWSDLLLAPAGFLVYAVLAGLLTSLVTGFIPGFNAEQVQDVGFDSISHYYEYVLAFITLVVIAPFAEEVLIRGYLYGKLRKFTSFAVAILISSLLFALMHFQWNVAVSVFPLAIVMVVLREKTDSIWAGILLHMMKNGIAFYLLFINPSLLNTIGR